MTEKRKLIEVALPLEAINRESAREKSIRHGHPSTLHLWWARRPLAACRAILFASYVDDPSAHPDEFPTEEAQQAERERLFRIIEDLVKWENTTNEDVLKAAREEIRKSCGDDPPPVYDPFCGAGSIPLEAQRLGLTAYASDLNPVAVLISKALIEIPPKFAGRPPVHPDDGKLKGTASWAGARGLAEDVRHYGDWMRGEAERRIGHLYPTVKLPPEHGGGEAMVIAWIWARTVECPNPACGLPLPLIRSFDLSTRKGQRAWARPVADRTRKSLHFEVASGVPLPEEEGRLASGTSALTVSGSKAQATFRCPTCDQGVVGGEDIDREAERHGLRHMPVAVVASAGRRRVFLSVPDEHANAVSSATEMKQKLEATFDFPREASRGTFASNAQGRRYGFRTFSDYFSDRQLALLATMTELADEVYDRVLADEGASGRGSPLDGYAEAVSMLLALSVSKLSVFHNTLSRWRSGEAKSAPAFGRQGIAMVWDFAEVHPFAGAGGDWTGVVDGTASVLERLPVQHKHGHVVQLDSTSAFAAVEAPPVICTDPPYYDNIGYADLSDFFYVWLRRSLRRRSVDVLGTILTPKVQELIASPYRFEGSRDRADEHFRSGLLGAFRLMRSQLVPEFPATVFYAFRQAEIDDGLAGVASTGWEQMLESLLEAGLRITGTWPSRTESATRMVAMNRNALATSVVLVCRPRSETASLATRKDFLAALKAELPDALRHLQQGSIAPVDLAQAAIGPGMGVFSRYSKVVEADGSAMSVRTALGLINQVLDETLAEQEADFDGDTRWAVAWFEQYGVNTGPFGVAETLSKAKNTAINGLVAAGILESKAGKVRLLDRAELPGSWNPTADGRLTVWELAQHLIRALESGGENQAADLLRRVGGLGETARELAYRLYVICERKKWAKEALAYNALVVAWPEISRLAASAPASSGPAQQELL